MMFCLSCNVPPRIKLFGWRACVSTLPTTYNISAKVLSFSITCSVCAHAEDTATHGYAKLNFDAGLVAENFAGWGFILRDHDGNILLTGIKHCQGYAGASVEEARAYLHGLSCPHTYGIHNIIIESDCLELIQMLRNKSLLGNSIHLFVRDIISFV
ncbi:hypothetical protein Cgig2_023014 [Carnegiea gigantea]|uniref:RNase H type-1 domain-containing protein n=1 Tax=Carnegiea gigantea TaxID=171969 RepID=A0A9Q1QE61_9CARY|nr:hypothetical protein Cgig2_023014 [Carnegiea gigantea]